MRFFIIVSMFFPVVEEVSSSLSPASTMVGRNLVCWNPHRAIIENI